MTSANPSVRKAVVVGAGPVGSLAAIALAKSGWDIHIYEGRPDMRLPSSKAAASQRSINLAISSRGITALQAIDPAATDRFLQNVIPMRGRMIHNEQGNLKSQPYDKDGQCINSIDRALLNEGLLDRASSISNIHVSFNHKVQSVDFDGRTMVVRDLETNKDVQIDFDLCIGADGSYSVIRRQMMRVVRMNYHQEYIPHEYLELRMPSGQGNDGKPTFPLDPNHLHIWPRHVFMLIALPNKDKSFTCTLFAPTADFERLSTRPKILSWFRLYFPDALSVIGEESLFSAFEKNPRSPLISTKSNPYHYKDRAILLGDAAHSMVPFYGQGLNCGLEDVRILDILLRQEGVQPTSPPTGAAPKDFLDKCLSNALSRYSETRHEDLVAICDLAMDNFFEMRHAVTTPAYMFRKTLDFILASLSSRPPISQSRYTSMLSRVPFPSGEHIGWLPLYTMVTFRPDISYATAKKKSERQSQVLANVGWIGSAFMSTLTVSVTWIMLQRMNRRR